MSRACNAAVLQLFLELLTSLLFVTKVVGGFGDSVVTYLQPPLDCL